MVAFTPFHRHESPATASVNSDCGGARRGSGGSSSPSLRHFFPCLQTHLFPLLALSSGLRLLLWTAFSCSSRRRHLHRWGWVRSTHLEADRARLRLRQAAQGGATPGLEHPCCSLAGLTFASLGHGNSRASRRLSRNSLFLATRFCDSGWGGGGWK